MTLGLMVGCGNTPTPTAEVPGGVQLEAEAGTDLGDALTTQETVEGGAITKGYVFGDAAASGGQAMMLYSTNSAVRFTLPASLPAGTYTVRVRGRAQSYNGNPIVALKLGGTQLGSKELTSASYSTYTFGNYALKAGDTLDVVFTNDAYGGTSGTDRNAIVDYLALDPVASTGTGASTPAPAPAPAPAPTAPAPTTPTTPVPAGAVDVRTFGAKGDGVTDDTLALQRAADSRKSLLFTSGRYLISNQITFVNLNGVTVAGQEATIVAKAGTPDTGALLMFSNPVNVRIQGLTVTGKNTGNGDTTPWQDGVWIAGGSDTTLDGLTISKVAGNAIRVVGATRTTVQNSTIFAMGAHGIGGVDSTSQKYLNNTITGLHTAGMTVNTRGIGILVTAGSDVLVEGNRVSKIANTAVKSEGTNNVTFRGNTVSEYHRDGIKIMPLQDRGYSIATVSNGVIDGNTVGGYQPLQDDACGSGLKLVGVLGGKITGNTYNGVYGSSTPNCGWGNNQEDGITLEPYNGANPPSNVTISGNTVNASYTGARLKGSSITFSNNKLLKAKTFALVFNRDTSGTQVTGNTLEAGANIVALLDAGDKNTTFSGNTFIGSDTGVYSDSSQNTGTQIVNNTFGAMPLPVNYNNASYACSGNTGTRVSSTCR